MASRKQYALEILLGAKTEASYYSNIKNAGNSIDGLTKTAKKAAGLITGAFAAINIAGTVKDAVEVYSDFEQELASSAAIAGATESEYIQMEQAARDAGKATIKTAQESASALGYMALAGWDVEESTQALMPVLELSAATNLDLATASDLVTDSMSAMKLSVADLPEYLDMVTMANNSSNTTSEALMRAFIKTGGAARTLKIDTQETATALGILANNGTKAEIAGNAMNSMLTRMASNESALKQMKALKIKIFEKGEFVGLEEALKRINKGVENLSVEKKAQALKEIAGTQYYSRMAYLLDGVKQGANGAQSAWDELQDKLEASEGSLDKMYDKMTDTMSGAKETMFSALDDAEISFADSFDGEIVEVFNGMGDAFNTVSENISDFSAEHEIEIHQTFEGIEEGVLAVGDVIGDVAGFAVEHFNEVATAAGGIGAALMANKAANGMTDILSFIENGGVEKIVSSLASPVGILTVAGAAIGAVGVYSIKAHEDMVEANLEEHFGNVSLSLEELDEIAQEIIGKKKLTKISTMLEAIGETNDAIENMTDSLATVNKISWKLNAGFEVDSTDVDLYKSAVESYVKNAQDALDSRGYSVHVATELLLGKNTKIGADNDAFYSELDTELAALQRKLNKKIEKAVENGVDINTDKSVKKLLNKISDIMNAMTQAENEAKLDTLSLKYSGKDLTPETFQQLQEDIKEYEEQASEGALEGYNVAVAALRSELNRGNLTQKQFDKRQKKLQQGYYDTKAQTMTDASSYMLNTIQEAYPEIGPALGNMQEKLREAFMEEVETGITAATLDDVIGDVIEKVISDTGVSEADQAAITELFKTGLGDVWSDMEELQIQIQNEGMNVPETLEKGISDLNTLSAISGSTDDAMVVFGEAINDSATLSAVVEACEGAGAHVSQYIADGMKNNSPEVAAAAADLLSLIESNLEGTMQFKITLDLVNEYQSIPNLDEVISASKPSARLSNSSGSKSTASKKSGGKKMLSRNAKGGIYNSPILTTFAEEGPEAAIPLDGSSRAKALWQNAGELLGMTPTEDKTLYDDVSKKSRDTVLYNSLLKVPAANPKAASPNINLTFAPQIEIKGNADEDTVYRAIKMSQSEFEEMMNQYLFSKGRVSFGG